MTEKPQTWKEKLAQAWYSVKVGERAENLRQTRRRFDNVDSLIMATRETLLGKDVVDNNRPEPEDMHIGDDYRTIHQYLPTQQQGSTVGTLAKLALGTGLLATGIGAPVAGYLIADGLKNQPVPTPAAAPAPAPVKDTDTDTQYEIFLDPPEVTK